jgi:hypothetical protein
MPAVAALDVDRPIRAASTSSSRPRSDATPELAQVRAAEVSAQLSSVDPAVKPAAAPNDSEPSTPPAYEPVSDEDAAMYELWRRGVAAGREPSGADLARAAGRANDASGIGRKAARRYREVHAEAQTAAVASTARFTNTHNTSPPSTAAAPHNGTPTPQHQNGRRPDGATA